MYASPQLERLLALVRDVYGRDLVGAYQHGSAVLGSMSPTSDLDVLVVTRRGTTDAERRRLVEALLALSVPPSAYDPAKPEERPIELTIVVEDEIRPWRFPARMDVQYGDWDRADFGRGVWPAARPNPDLAILIDVARRGSEALLGPAPASFFEPVPRADLVAAMVADLDALVRDLGPDTRNVLLTLARIRMTLETGEIHSKDQAAAWLVERLPAGDRPIMARAGELYLAGEYGPFEGLEDMIFELLVTLEPLVVQVVKNLHFLG